VGTLYLVATPIGNLEDVTLRALRVLREADLVFAEDTRRTRVLLDRHAIAQRPRSLHAHNESARIAEVLAALAAGQQVALVSDAGTPLVSDPGYRIVAAAIAAGIRVEPIPGASALLSALAAAGLPTDAFQFAGFLPPKSSARRKTLESLKSFPATLVFYEAPHRILETLDDIEEIMGVRPVVVARELTKLHEEFLRGTAREIRETLATRTSVKGEITLLIGRGEEPAAADGEPAEQVALLVEGGMTRMEAIKTVARRRGLGKREVYRLVEGEGASR